MPPGPVPVGLPWEMISHIVVKRSAWVRERSRLGTAGVKIPSRSAAYPSLAQNNYGRHTHSFRAKVLAWTWDWIGMAAPIAGINMITINGRFFSSIRWTKAGLESVEDLLQAADLGDRIVEIKQTPNLPRVAPPRPDPCISEPKKPLSEAHSRIYVHAL